MKHYSNDPRWITAKFNSHCHKCGISIKKGDKSLYYPIGRHIYCKKCGEPEYAEFCSAAWDEDNYNS